MEAIALLLFMLYLVWKWSSQTGIYALTVSLNMTVASAGFEDSG